MIVLTLGNSWPTLMLMSLVRTRLVHTRFSAGRLRSEPSLTGLGLRPPFSLPLPRDPSLPRLSSLLAPLPASSSRRGGRIPSLERWSRAGNFDLFLLTSPRINSPQLDSTRLDSPQLDSTRFVSFRLARLVSFCLASPFLSSLKSSRSRGL